MHIKNGEALREHRPNFKKTVMSLSLFLFVFNIIFFNSLFALSTNAQEALTAKKEIASQIELLIQQGLPNASVGVVLLEADTGQVLFARHAKEPFPPASTTKLFTAAAALLSLGADYQFQTTIKIDPQALQQNTLNGNLYIQFSGDPSLSIDDLKALISAVKLAGVHQIHGNIVIDDSRFQSPDYPMGWAWESNAWYYHAPVTTIILNENKVPITLTSHKTLGEKTKVVLASNDVPFIKPQANVLTVTEAEAASNCQIEVQMDELNQLNLKGCWPQLPKPTTLKVALKNPRRVAEKIIKDTLDSEKIIFTGKIVTGKVNQDLKTIASHHSKSLKTLLTKVLQDSNNLYAESLIKTLGVKHFQQGTFQAGILAMKEILSKPTGIDFKQLRLMGGAGASAYDLIQPDQLGRLLFVMDQDKAVGEDFKNVLPVSGGKENIESTLYTRFKFENAFGRIRAKTGTRTGVSALAGYLTTIKNQKLIFVIMIDHFVERVEKVKQFEDEFCRLLINLK